MNMLKEHSSFILILIVAIGLRFYNFYDIPFTHDEFSALFRLNYPTLNQLLELGVKNDGHPAGVQVFLYYWSSLFGTKEWIIKLPFIIMGTISVIIIYFIGKLWFNKTVGLITAAYLSSIQFAVMYSQIARPYSFGLCCAILMVYYWSKLIKDADKHFYKNAVLYITFSTLCAYTHHFCLLFAFIVGISGLFFLSKKYLIRYLFCGIAIFILYIPHINIFFNQLSLKGIEGWLRKPDLYFLSDFISYLFHYSYLNLLILIGIGIKQHSLKIKPFLLFSAWFIIPFLIGYFYSIYINAVLQFSVLIFSTPFLFFILFGHIKPLSHSKNFLIISIILLVNSLTLIFKRKHYNLFYNSVYKNIVYNAKKIKNKTTTEFLINCPKPIAKYYIKKTKLNNLDLSFIYLDSLKTPAQYISHIKQCYTTKNKIYLATESSLNPFVIPIIQQFYPKLESKTHYSEGSCFIFSKKRTPSTPFLKQIYNKKITINQKV